MAPCAAPDSENLGVWRMNIFSAIFRRNAAIVNLDLPEGFALPPVPVQVGQTGTLQWRVPVTLVRPDRNNFAPRLGSPGSLTQHGGPRRIWHQLQHQCVSKASCRTWHSSLRSRIRRRTTIADNRAYAAKRISTGASRIDQHNSASTRLSSGFMCRSGMWTCNSRFVPR